MNGNILKYLSILLLLNGLNAWRSYVIDLTNLEYEFNHDYIDSTDMKLIHDKGRNIINGSATVKKEVSNLLVYFGVTVPRPGNDWTLINVTLDGCKQLEAKAENSLNLPYIVLEEIRKSSKSFPKKCPIQKDTTIYIENAYLDPEKFPPYVPDMKFNSTLMFSETDEMILKAVVTGSVQSKRAAMKNRKTKIPTDETAS